MDIATGIQEASLHHKDVSLHADQLEADDGEDKVVTTDVEAKPAHSMDARGL